MQAFVISLVVNIILIILCLTLIYPKANKIYLQRKKLRQTQREQEIKEFIHKVVIDYLQKLQNDGGKD